jgi:hypothetical protein
MQFYPCIRFMKRYATIFLLVQSIQVNAQKYSDTNLSLNHGQDSIDRNFNAKYQFADTIIVIKIENSHYIKN